MIIKSFKLNFKATTGPHSISKFMRHRRLRCKYFPAKPIKTPKIARNFTQAMSKVLITIVMCEIFWQNFYMNFMKNHLCLFKIKNVDEDNEN
jgi:hypothetical protein